MIKLKILALVTLQCLIISAKGQIISINTADVIATNVSHKIGINMNTMRDNDANRTNARPIFEALQEMGVKHLRYPGGGKSNLYFWAQSPYTDPTTNKFLPGWYADASTGAGFKLLNFDEFMAICKHIDAIPHLNVGYNPQAGLNEDVAASWVKYANITKRYGVIYWEIGNEMWGSHKISADSLVKIAKSYSKAMKAVDPTIKIGVSWNNAEGYNTLLKRCGKDIDFVTNSDYPCFTWGSYNNYNENANFDLVNDSILKLVEGNKKMVISEFNAVDWGKTFGKPNYWPNTNDHGHGMVVFEIIGQILTNRRIDYGCFWNTRWAEKDDYSVYDALDINNQLLPVAKPLMVWGKFIKDNMVSISRTNTIVTYACYDSISGDLNLFLSNKATTTQTVSISISSPNRYRNGSVWQLKGSGPSITNPTWGKTGDVTISNQSISSIDLPATSITVIAISKKGVQMLNM